MQPQNSTIEGVPYYPDADTFDFQRSWERLRRACGHHKVLIFVTCLCTVCLVLGYTRIWPPTYMASVVLVGESDKDRSRESFYDNWAVFRNDQLTDEVHMLTSAPVLDEVINRLHLTDDEMYHSFLGYIGYRWSTSWVGKTYKAVKEWVFPPVRGPYDPAPEEIAAAQTLYDFKGGVSFDPVMETDIGSLVVRGSTPRVAQIANTIIDVYFEQRRARHVTEAEAAYSALEDELKKAQSEVDAVEQKMRDYYDKNDLLLVFEKDKIDIGQVEALKASIVELGTGVRTNTATLNQIDEELQREPKEVIASSVSISNTINDGLKEKLSALQVQRKQTLLNYKPNSPEVEELNRQIAIVSEQLKQTPDRTLGQTTTVLSSHYEELRGQAASLRAQLAGQRANLAAKQEVYDTLETQLRSIPSKMQTVHDLEREHGTLEKKADIIREKMEIAAVSRATAQTAYSSIRVVEPAAAPGDAAWPKTKLLLLIASGVGLLAGVLLASLVDLFFGRVHRFRLGNVAKDLPIYAIVRRDGMSVPLLYGLPASARTDYDDAGHFGP